MSSELIDELCDLTLLLANTHHAGQDVAHILVNIFRKGTQAYVECTGKPLNPELIRAESTL